MHLETKISRCLSKVEKLMLELCNPGRAENNLCYQAVVRHLSAGGNRLRARVALESGLSLGLSRQDCVCLAAACELLHNASLVQDDYFDKEESRRGTPSIWKAFTPSVAICCGDLMVSAAYASVALVNRPELLAELIHLMHRRTAAVIISQPSEQAAASGGLGLREYEELAAAKSGELLALPLQLPLLLAGHQQELSKAKTLASSFAIAYQICDDLQDFEQDTLSGCLNVVRVLMHAGRTQEQAEFEARVRADSWLQCALDEIATLPCQCSLTLGRHANALLGWLGRPAFQEVA